MNKSLNKPIPSLHETLNDAAALECLILEKGGELCPEIEAWLAEVEQNLGTKSDHYKFVMDRLESTAKLLKEKADQFISASRSINSARDRLKERIKNVMKFMNRDNIVGSFYKVALVKGAPKMIIDEQTLPITFKNQVITWEPNREKIKSVIEMGTEVPGVTVESVFALRFSVNKEKA